MQSAWTNSGTKIRLNIFGVSSRFIATNLAAIPRRALALAALCALLLIAARSAQAQTETVLYNFNFINGSYPDGAQPLSRLTSDRAGNFYGTTYNGGLWGYGTVFELSPNGNGGWNENVLYSFCPAPSLGCPDGASPAFSYVMFDNAGNLYGTACLGGPTGHGVVFELSPTGAGWTETVLYSFAGGPNAESPVNGLIMDPAGTLYGTTFDPGGMGGSVFELSPSGGSWTEQVIYNLDTTLAGLTMDAAGNIFGVGATTAFELSPNGNGGWIPNVIHTFAGAPKDGSDPEGTLVLDKAGNLYGTTWGGGLLNYGTVYELIPGKKGKWIERILHSFKNSPKDGGWPVAGVVFDSAGNIYGTTEYGGKSQGGSVFELVAPVVKGGYKEKVLWSFNASDGEYPVDSLILDGTGHLYGTASEYGPNAKGPFGGVVFEITP